jgi:predicted SprT family Zn-dependent metalloprotease
MRLLFKSEPDWRYYKEGQLLFQFDVDLEGGTRCPQRVGKTLPRKLSGLDLTSSSEKPIHQCGRDHALEEKSRTLLRALGAGKLAREIRVEWNPRLQTAAGRADFREKLISLNPRLRDHRQGRAKNHFLNAKLDYLKQSSLTSAGPVVSQQTEQHAVVHDEIDRTLRHELAHLLAQFREKRRRRIAPHGPEWREACRDLGIADEARCHNLPFATKVYPRRFVYCCPNCRREFPRVRKIRRAIACLACCRKHNGGEFDPCFRLKLTTKCSGACSQAAN